MLIGSWSQVNKFPCAQYPIIISYNSIVVRPPYKKTEDLIVPFGLRKIFLPKKRFVSLHSQKNYAARSIIYIRPMVILFLGAWRSQLTFGFEKGRSSGRRNRPRVTFFCEGCNPVFGYNKFQRSCRKVISLFYSHVRNTRRHDGVNFSVV